MCPQAKESDAGGAKRKESEGGGGVVGRGPRAPGSAYTAMRAPLHGRLSHAGSRARSRIARAAIAMPCRALRPPQFNSAAATATATPHCPRPQPASLAPASDGRNCSVLRPSRPDSARARARASQSSATPTPKLAGTCGVLHTAQRCIAGGRSVSTWTAGRDSNTWRGRVNVNAGSRLLEQTKAETHVRSLALNTVSTRGPPLYVWLMKVR